MSNPADAICDERGFVNNVTANYTCNQGYFISEAPDYCTGNCRAWFLLRLGGKLERGGLGLRVAEESLSMQFAWWV
jgi:hypothetical protein